MAAPPFEPTLGNMSAMYVIGTDVGELKAVFDKLAIGADKQHFQELHQMPFGTHGQFYDKYGMQWIFRGQDGANTDG
ncbi:MAG: hypothetical protein M3Z30_04795 [Gemmatimonadota bacterium]|nr:hypothetical protein [Gemmatimonadota bacterium]